MAFDGPTPFDGDPAFMFLDEVEDQSPADVRAALLRAFKAINGDDYVEVDEGVWPWCAAELVAVARGTPPAKLPPEPFLSAARSLRNVEALARPALAALAVVVDTKRSEVAELWEESGDGTLDAHVSGLRARLKSKPKRAPSPTKAKASKSAKGARSKRQRLKPGVVVRIPLTARQSGFAQFTGDDFGFFDLRSTSTKTRLEDVVKAPIIFRVGMYGPDDGVTTGRWPILGVAPIVPDLTSPLATFKVGEYSGPGTGFYRYERGVGTKVKFFTEIEGLEPAGVCYRPQSIEKRLKAHFAGKGQDYTFGGIEIRESDLFHPAIPAWLGFDRGGECARMVRAYQRARAKRKH